jgi:hypothetical protein
MAEGHGVCRTTALSGIPGLNLMQDNFPVILSPDDLGKTVADRE